DAIAGAVKELPILEEWTGVLFDGTDDEVVVRFDLSPTRGKTVQRTREVSDALKLLPSAGPGSPDWSKHMILALGCGGHITKVVSRKDADGSLPVVVVKWRYNHSGHDKAYHAVRVPAAEGTVLFEFSKPKRPSLREQPDIPAPWSAEGKSAPESGRPRRADISQRPTHQLPPGVIMQRPVETALSPAMLEQRPCDDFPALLQQRPVHSMPMVGEQHGEGFV
ncbi:unnamed protein product, partial [Symbiodinium sp. KB8]